MILAGIKKEEYREIKPYWDSRLLKKSFDVVLFRNGYQKNARVFSIEFIELSTGFGIVEWGAPEKEIVYILKLGNIIV